MDSISEEASRPKPPVKQGRPSSGKALTAAERQKHRLAKLQAESKALLPQVVVSQALQEALFKFIKFKDGMRLGDALDRIVRDRLMRKRSEKRKPKPKQTQVRIKNGIGG